MHDRGHATAGRTSEQVCELTVVTPDGAESRTVRVPHGARALLGLPRRGIPGIPIGCRGGGCGVCRVRVAAGTYDVARMSRRHVSDADAATGVVLACRLLPLSDLTIEPAPGRAIAVAPDRIGNKETPTWH